MKYIKSHVHSSILLLIAGVFLGACGYTLQRTEQPPMLLKQGIRTVYVEPFVNNTYKAGVENVIYNQVIKVIASNRRVKILQNKELADSVLSGTVTQASYVPSATIAAQELFPKDRTGMPRGSADIRVASEYSASLECSFALSRRLPESNKSSVLWTGGFARSKPFPGNNQLGAFGVTSALINESEFDRALKDLAESVSSDLHEAMLAGF